MILSSAHHRWPSAVRRWHKPWIALVGCRRLLTVAASLALATWNASSQALSSPSPPASTVTAFGVLQSGIDPPVPVVSIRPASVPEHWTNITSIAAAAFQQFATTTDGRFLIEGSYQPRKYLYRLRAPTALQNIATATGGDAFTAALTADGRLLGWGARHHITLGMEPFRLPSVLEDIAAVSGPYALTRRGHVVSWTDDNTGQTTRPGLSNIVAIASSESVGLALRADGTLTGWGDDPLLTSTILPGLTRVVAIAVGGRYTLNHALALRADGTVVAWGDNSAGQCNVPVDLGEVVAIAAGYRVSLALTAEGRVRAWGKHLTLDGQSEVPIEVPSGLSNVVEIAAGHGFGMALSGLPPDIAPPAPAGPRVLLAGYRHPFQHRLQARNGASRFRVSALPAGLAVDPGSGRITGSPEDAGTHTLIVTAENRHGSASWPIELVVHGVPAITRGGTQLARFGQAFTHTINADFSPRSFGAAGLPPDLEVDTATGRISGKPSRFGDFPVTLVASNALGSGLRRLLIRVPMVVTWGDGPLEPATAPAGLGQVVAISAGGYRAMALTADGRVVEWGQPGPDLPGTIPFPAQLTHVSMIASDFGHGGTAVTSDGKAHAWGVMPPVPASLSNLVALSLGGTHGYALDDRGQAMSWDGDRTYRGPDHLVSISAGYGFCAGLRDDGRVMTWGSSPPGPLPSGLSHVVAIASGWDFVLALTTEGRVVGWGRSGGQVAKPPRDLQRVVAIAAGNNHALALTAEGTVVAWNDAGPTPDAVPVGLRGVIAIAARGNQSIALLRNPDLPDPNLAWSTPTPHFPPELMLRGSPGASVVVLSAGDLSGPWRANRPITLRNASSPVPIEVSTTSSRFFRCLGTWPPAAE